jgi:hypothetical protein
VPLGTSDSGFRAEVDSELALARGEHLLALTDAHDHQHLTGPAAGEAARRLGEFAAQARFAGTVVTDAQRLRRLMQRGDPAVYPGAYSTCVHDHTKALCRSRTDTAGRQRPQLGSCLPLQCQNIAMTAENTQALHHEAHRLNERLSLPPLLPPLVEHQLRQRHQEIVAFLTRHNGAADPR